MAKHFGRGFVACKIERSPFSDERIFSVLLPDGSEHIGTGSYIYFTRRKGQPLKADEPPRGKPLQGAVEAIVIQEEEDSCTVSFPDGSVATVARSAVKMRKEASPDVPVQP